MEVVQMENFCLLRQKSETIEKNCSQKAIMILNRIELTIVIIEEKMIKKLLLQETQG